MRGKRVKERRRKEKGSGGLCERRVRREMDGWELSIDKGNEREREREREREKERKREGETRREVHTVMLCPLVGSAPELSLMTFLVTP
jgi:hypothetical protein